MAGTAAIAEPQVRHKRSAEPHFASRGNTWCVAWVETNGPDFFQRLTKDDVFVVASVSVDAGTTWVEPRVLASGRVADPFVVATDDGQCFVSWLSVVGDAMSLTGAALRDDTVTVEDIAEIAEGALDKPTTLLAEPGRLLTAYSTFRPQQASDGYTIDVSYRSSSAPDTPRMQSVIVSHDRSLAMPYLCNDSSGRVYVVYLKEEGVASYDVQVRWSDDGGVSWPGRNVVTIPTSKDVALHPPQCAVAKKGLWVSYGVRRGQPDGYQQVDRMTDLHLVRFNAKLRRVARLKHSKRPDLMAWPQLVIAGDKPVVFYFVYRERDPEVRATAALEALSVKRRRCKIRTVIEELPFSATPGLSGWPGDYFGVQLVEESVVLLLASEDPGALKFFQYNVP